VRSTWILITALEVHFSSFYYALNVGNWTIAVSIRLQKETSWSLVVKKHLPKLKCKSYVRSAQKGFWSETWWNTTAFPRRLSIVRWEGWSECLWCSGVSLENAESKTFLQEFGFMLKAVFSALYSQQQLYEKVGSFSVLLFWSSQTPVQNRTFFRSTQQVQWQKGRSTDLNVPEHTLTMHSVTKSALLCLPYVNQVW
jgi:hypothetical protein